MAEGTDFGSKALALQLTAWETLSPFSQLDHRTTLSSTVAQPWSKDNNISKNGFDRERDNRIFTVFKKMGPGSKSRKKEAGGREDTFSSAVSSRVSKITEHPLYPSLP